MRESDPVLPKKAWPQCIHLHQQSQQLTRGCSAVRNQFCPVSKSSAWASRPRDCGLGFSELPIQSWHGGLCSAAQPGLRGSCCCLGHVDSRTCLNRSKGLDREGVPVSKMARRLRLRAETVASVWAASGARPPVRRVWLSSAMMIFQPFAAMQCCRQSGGASREHSCLAV